MADHTKTITLTDVQQKLLSNDLYNDTDNAGIDTWIQEAIDGKVNNCWKRFRNEWTQKLMDDSSFTDSICEVYYFHHPLSLSLHYLAVKEYSFHC